MKRLLLAMALLPLAAAAQNAPHDLLGGTPIYGEHGLAFILAPADAAPASWFEAVQLDRNAWRAQPDAPGYFTDWRLPTAEEFELLRGHAPAELHLTPGLYWMGEAADEFYAYVKGISLRPEGLAIDEGPEVMNKHLLANVRLVRVPE